MQKKDVVCPCHSGESYDNCCKKFHQGTLPTTALSLMRSRYSAYALALAPYILASSAADFALKGAQRQRRMTEVAQFCKITDFINLTILDNEEGEQEATVTFRAFLTQQGHDASFSEKSRFIKRRGRWFYQCGEIL